MVARRGAAYAAGMREARDLSPPSPGFSLLAVAALLAFTGFTLWVCLQHGVLGFVPLVRGEPWGLQMMLDLIIALVVALRWVISDARRRGHSPWPFAVATVLLGSIGVLAYLAWRGVAGRRRAEA